METEREARHAEERQRGYDLALGATFNDVRVRFEYRAPLLERLRHISARIARMCREGKPPAMSIPAKAYDDDMFITAAVEDAIAALSAPTWIPIPSVPGPGVAPWDGKPWQIWTAYGKIPVVANFSAGRWWLVDEDGHRMSDGRIYLELLDRPTHYAPLPAPPLPDQESDHG